jgi:hypothetical protein
MGGIESWKVMMIESVLSVTRDYQMEVMGTCVKTAIMRSLIR